MYLLWEDVHDFVCTEKRSTRFSCRDTTLTFHLFGWRRNRCPDPSIKRQKIWFKTGRRPFPRMLGPHPHRWTEQRRSFNGEASSFPSGPKKGAVDGRILHSSLKERVGQRKWGNSESVAMKFRSEVNRIIIYVIKNNRNVLEAPVSNQRIHWFQPLWGKKQLKYLCYWLD